MNPLFTARYGPPSERDLRRQQAYPNQQARLAADNNSWGNILSQLLPMGLADPRKLHAGAWNGRMPPVVGAWTGPLAGPNMAPPVDLPSAPGSDRIERLPPELETLLMMQARGMRR